MDPLAAAASLADGLTAVAAAFDAAWIVARRVRGETLQARRIAAATLALVCAGIAAQAAFSQALFAAHRLGAPTAPLFAPAPWLTARLALLCGTAMLSLLILRTGKASAR